MTYPRLAKIEIDGWEIEDGEERNREVPDSFWIPPFEQRINLMPGQIVKLIFRIRTIDENGQEEYDVERMWVLFQEKFDDLYRGLLDNDPHCTDDVKAGLEDWHIKSL